MIARLALALLLIASLCYAGPGARRLGMAATQLPAYHTLGGYSTIPASASTVTETITTLAAGRAISFDYDSPDSWTGLYIDGTLVWDDSVNGGGRAFYTVTSGGSHTVGMAVDGTGGTISGIYIPHY